MTDRAPRADVVAEGRRIGGAASAAGVALKLTGGVAVAPRCPSARRAPLQRDYADIDVVGRARDRRAITELLGQLTKSRCVIALTCATGSITTKRPSPWLICCS